MPYIGEATTKLYQVIDIPDDATAPQKELLEALIAYRGAWAGVKQKKSLWDQVKDKDYFESTLLQHLIELSEENNWGMTRKEIKQYCIGMRLFKPFEGNFAIEAYLENMKKIDSEGQRRFYFLMEKVPDLIEGLEEAGTDEVLLEIKRAEIREMVGAKTYLLDAIPSQLMGVNKEQSEDLHARPDWVLAKSVSEEEVRHFAPLYTPIELIDVIKARKEKQLLPLPLLEDARYIAWFAEQLQVCGIQDNTFSGGHLALLRAADKYLLNGGKISFKLQCLFDSTDWFAAMEQYKASYEAPFEDMNDLGRELYSAMCAMFRLLFNLLAILTTVALALVVEAVLIASLALFFEPHTFMTVFSLSQAIPGGIVAIPLIVVGALGLMLATASAATGILSNLLHETPSLPSDVRESFARLGSRICASFNQGISEPAATDVSTPEKVDTTQTKDDTSPDVMPDLRGVSS
ncbi:MAG: hypothetical protein P1U32_01185 [Legionellaceae bacterium]|nr:hypothetical protein [Legionellaceae bacterium]